MELRILKVSTYYRGFLNDYYLSNPGIDQWSYHDQYNHLMGQCFAWSDNYGRLLREKGHETFEVVANARPLQLAWGRENLTGKVDSMDEILEGQIGHFQPDVIYFQDSITYSGSYLRYLRSKFQCIKLIIGNVCAPFSNQQIEGFSDYDYFTVCSPQFGKQLARYGIHSVLIPHAFDRRVLEKIHCGDSPPTADIVFIGSIFADEGFHSLRREVLEQLIKEKIDIDFYGNLPDRSLYNLFKRQASYVAAHSLPKIGLQKVVDSITSIRKGLNHPSMPKPLRLSRELYRLARPPVFGLEMFNALSKARIGFNIHIDCAGEYAANMRMFETTGVGSCLVTDWKKNLSTFFEEDREVVSYKTSQECIEKIRWLVDHPAECKSIALRGQEKALKVHSFENRVDLLNESIQSFFVSKCL